MRFGALVRAYRLRAGLTQEDLAHKAMVSVRALRNIEADRTQLSRPTTVRMIADALSLSGRERGHFETVATGARPADELAPDRVRPAQLPLDVFGFTGRDAELARLDQIADAAAGQPTAVVVVAVWGTAGVGKSALAVHWAHRVAGRFPDGQMYVNLRGFDTAATGVEPAAAVRAILEALGMSPQRIPSTVEAQIALYRSLLADKRVLVVLDNAISADQVRPLLPGSPGCLSLVTSRNQLTGLVAAQAARPLALDVLAPADARQLLARRLGPDRLAVAGDLLDDVVELCAGLPLALTIVAARVATAPVPPFAALTAELRRARGALDLFDTGDPGTDLRAVLSWSYAALPAPAARLFRLLGPNTRPDAGAAAAASLAGCRVDEVEPLLDELTRASLLSQPALGRFGLHDLLREYATELGEQVDGAADRRAALHRLLDHYLHSAHHGAGLLHPHRDVIELEPPAAGVVRAEFADDTAALAWFTAEHAALLAAVRLATEHGFDAHVWQLAWSLATYFDWRGHWHDQVAVQRAALDAARRLDNQPAQALILRNVGLADGRLGRYGDGEASLRQAVGLYARLADRTGEARTHGALSWTLELQGRDTEALAHARCALALYQAAGHRAGEARSLNAVGWYHAKLGEHRQAVAWCRRALARLAELGDRYGEAETLDSIGFAHHHLGEYPDAIECYATALELYRGLGDRRGEADTLVRLGDTHLAAGRPGLARAAWQDALSTVEALDHPGIDEIRAKLDRVAR